MIFSVIVPTYKDWPSLQACLGALQAQTFDRELFETIIVDNNEPDSPVPDLQFPPGVRVLRQTVPGSYAARNLGVRNAKGEVLAFTDSDCTPDPHWLENAASALGSETNARITGPVTIYRSSGGGGAAYLYEKTLAFRSQKTSAVCKSAVTANLIVPKSIFKNVGYFRDDLFSGGDTEWNARAGTCGVRLVHSDDVVVFHPARKTLREIARKERRKAGGRAGLRGRNPAAYMWGKVKPPINELRLAETTHLSNGEVILMFFIIWTFRIAALAEFIAVKTHLKSPIRA